MSILLTSANPFNRDAPAREYAHESFNNIRRLEILEDKDKKLTILDVISPEYSGKFKSHTEKTNDFGYTKSAVWVRFTIEGLNEEEWILELKNQWVSRASLYLSDRAGRYHAQEAGIDLPYAERAIRSRNIAFKLEPIGQKTVTCHLRVESDIYKLMFPLAVHTANSYSNAVSMEKLIFGIFLGIVAALFFYNLFLYLSLRESAYLFYVLAILCIGTFQLIVNGFAQSVLWPENPHWNKIIFIMPCCGILIGGPFVSRYMKTGEHTPHLHVFLKWVSFAGWPLMMTGILTYLKILEVQAHIILMSVAYALLSTGILSAGIICLKKGYSPAKYALLAFASYLAGLIIFALMINGIFPGEYLANISIQQFTSAFGMILLSLGLADRINVIRRDQEYERQLSHETELRFRDARIRSQRLELELLKKTIQPHFVMNTLTAVRSWLMECPEKAVRLIDALADELRPIISHSDLKLIPLRDEIGLCRSHLVVMGLRLDREYELMVAGATGNETVPPLIFHTMMENAFTHGDPYRFSRFSLVKEPIQGGTRFIFSVESAGNAECAIHEGVGIRYIRTRLEESYPQCWSLDCGQSGGLWRSIIEIREESL